MPGHIRINELALQLGVKAGFVLASLQDMGVTRKLTHSSSIEVELAERLRRELGEEGQATAPRNVTSTPVFSRGGSAETLSESATSGRIVPIPQGLVPLSPVVIAASSAEETRILALPTSFTFNRRGFIDFDNVLKYMNWDYNNCPVIIDLTTCESANFQALALLIQYGWQLTLQGCAVTFKYGIAMAGPTKMLSKMGASQWREILLDDGRDFDTRLGGQTIALRRRSDAQSTINRARTAINRYSIRFPDYLSYIISELLYNATEHGRRQALVGGSQILVPAIFQFGYYSFFHRVSFLFSDLGVGIKSHLEQVYPAFSTHQEAILYALRPRVSGTFRQQAEPYSSKDNAGLGLTYSSRMLKHLKGDMYIVALRRNSMNRKQRWLSLVG